MTSVDLIYFECPTLFYLCSPAKSDDFLNGYVCYIISYKKNVCYIINHINFMSTGMNLTLLIFQIAVSLSKLFTVLLLFKEWVIGSWCIVLKYLSVQVHTLVWLSRSCVLRSLFLCCHYMQRPHSNLRIFGITPHPLCGFPNQFYRWLKYGPHMHKGIHRQESGPSTFTWKVPPLSKYCVQHIYI